MSGLLGYLYRQACQCYGENKKIAIVYPDHGTASEGIFRGPPQIRMSNCNRCITCHTPDRLSIDEMVQYKGLATLRF